MRLVDMVRFGMKYAAAGCVTAVVAAILFLLGYKFIYQKKMHGTKKVSKWQALWFVFLVAYGVILLGATFLSRSSFYGGAQVVPPFASYREAWYQGRMANVRNLIVNILLFVPLGFWLPVGLKRFRSLLKTGLAGFTVTFLVEVLQIATRRGIFEFDDILNNLAGTLVGYGFFALAYWLFVEKSKKKTVLKMVVCQLPLVLCLAAIASVCIAYGKQELGNLAIHYITRVPIKKFELITDLETAVGEGTAPVYQVKQYSLQETRQVAEKILGMTGTVIHDNETDIYDDTVFYRGTGKHISIEYKGAVYNYTDFDALYSQGRLKEKSDATEEEVKDALGKLGVEIPADASFENTGNGRYLFTANAIVLGGIVYDGHLTCTCMEGGIISQIYNKIYVGTPYKEFGIISEKEALEQVQEGKFQLFSENTGKCTINLQNVHLGYMLDSKSFYQPVYLFDGTVDGHEYQIQIPAVK